MFGLSQDYETARPTSACPKFDLKTTFSAPTRRSRGWRMRCYTLDLLVWTSFKFIKLLQQQFSEYHISQTPCWSLIQIRMHKFQNNSFNTFPMSLCSFKYSLWVGNGNMHLTHWGSIPRHKGQLNIIIGKNSNPECYKFNCNCLVRILSLPSFFLWADFGTPWNNLSFIFDQFSNPVESWLSSVTWHRF